MRREWERWRGNSKRADRADTTFDFKDSGDFFTLDV